MSALQKLAKLAKLGGRLIKLGCTSPSKLSHVLGSALAASDEVADASVDLLRFPHVTIEDLLPEESEAVRMTLVFIPRVRASISALEAVALILLMKKAKAKRVFEFGTYKGLSITQLAVNLPADSRICTLDLPEDDPRSAFAITDPEDLEIALEKGKGSRVPDDVRDRIQFLRQDSATLEVTPYVGQMDFVFVDGAHNAPYVRNDSEKGWQMLRAGGIIAWHDCRPQDPAVVRFLLQSPYRPTRIRQTTVAFAIKP